jgi:hypothetical protein
MRFEVVIPSAALFTAERGISRGSAQLMPSRDSRAVNVLPVLCKIVPVRVLRLNQSHFLAASPSFNLFFTGNRLIRIRARLVIGQSREVVTTRKAWNKLVPVLKDSAATIARNTGIQNVKALHVTHDVNVIEFLHDFILQTRNRLVCDA